MKKAKRKLIKSKAKAKKAKVIRSYLVDVNQHCAQLSAALRGLADRLDDVRSYHLKDERDDD